MSLVVNKKMSQNNNKKSIIFIAAGILLILLFFVPFDVIILSAFTSLSGLSRQMAERHGFYPLDKFIKFIKSLFTLLPGLYMAAYGITGLLSGDDKKKEILEKIKSAWKSFTEKSVRFFRSNENTIFLVGFIICLAIFVSFIAGYRNVKMDYVEGRNLQLLRHFALYGVEKARDLKDVRVVTIGPMLSLPVLFSFKTLGVSLGSARFVTIIYLVLFMAVFLKLSRELYGRWVMLALFATIIFLPRFYLMALPVIGYIPGMFFYLSGLLCFHLRLKNDKPWLLWLTGIFWAFAGLTKIIFLFFSLLSWAIFFLWNRFSGKKLPAKEFFYPVIPVIILPLAWHFILSFIVGQDKSALRLLRFWMHKYPPLKPASVNAMVYLRNIRSWMGFIFPEFVFLTQLGALYFLLRKFDPVPALVWLMDVMWMSAVLLFDSPIFLHHSYLFFVLWFLLLGYVIKNLTTRENAETEQAKSGNGLTSPPRYAPAAVVGIIALFFIYAAVFGTFVYSQVSTARHQKELTAKQYELVDYVNKEVPKTALVGGVSPELAKIVTFLSNRDYYDFSGKDIPWDKECYVATVYYSYTISNYEGDMNKDLDEKLIKYWSLPIGELDKYAKVDEFDLDTHKWELVNPPEEDFIKKHCKPIAAFGGYRLFRVVKDYGKNRPENETDGDSDI